MSSARSEKSNDEELWQAREDTVARAPASQRRSGGENSGFAITDSVLYVIPRSRYFDPAKAAFDLEKKERV
ncbi:hypothetical protein Nepgr_016851 [Nepenthes gracilis]|uniref:Uncharacterized protein n=1 Tax=Nepenthes gracilis TaxID=150966 RepID=A0AAD3SQG7_NEPGR|nr:hypothetical protein Nepgr_016851 [Nepenthes gracilis]